ncbi:MAG TPA: glycoside hydrolase family 3 protein [Polyangiaceae bacterium]|nr:glycoside hydrolase family 3 protein [Polyangiaceae bacterium]
MTSASTPHAARRSLRRTLLALPWALALAAPPSSAQPAAKAKSDAATPASTTSARVDRLVKSLTPGEAIDLLGGTGFGTQAIPRAGIPAFSMSDGPAGVRSPAPSIAYASGIALAASWDEALAERVGHELGRDARARGVQFLLGPGVNLYRSPLNGRNFEYFGEDPWLAARIAVGYVRGVQSERVSATIKHFVGNESEFARRTTNSVIDERALRELYLLPFEVAVKEANVGAIMCAYNRTNGEPMSANRHLITDVLKNEWGFDGVFMSDWGATADGLSAARAGLDLEMPNGKFMNRTTLEPALLDGSLPRELVDDKVRRLLKLASRFGWLDTTAPDLSISHFNAQGRDAARQSALEGAVLLRNAKNLLPLDPARLDTLAVIGPLAHPGEPTGGGSGKVPVHHNVSLLEGLSEALGTSATVTYSPGLPPLRSLAMRAAFSTKPTGGESGLLVEEFATPELSGAPVATRIEWTIAKGSPAFLGDADGLQLRDSVPRERMRARREARDRNDLSRRYERWTGWFTPERAGEHTLFVQSGAGYRVRVDGKLVLDSAGRSDAMLRQAHLTLTPQPHEVIFEEAPGGEKRQPFFRVGLFHDEASIDPTALQLAARADAVVVAVGFDSEIEIEATDREFALPPGQERLIRALAAKNRNVIVVLTSGGSVDTSPWLGDVEALVAQWYPGQEGGTALAQLLLGRANFSGRLPITWERRLADNPTAKNYHPNEPSDPSASVYREGLFMGYRGYQEQKARPVFPFGFGLSYTRFRYGAASARAVATSGIASSNTNSNGPRPTLYEVSFDLTNTGERKGAEVAQIYVAPPPSKLPRPRRELRAFTRVELTPGETRHVSVNLDARAFTYFDPTSQRWQADPGKYTIELARSADDVESRTEITLARPLTLDPKD